MKMAAKRMKTRATRISGEIVVGDVVQLGLHDVDRTKVDGSNLTGVAVQILENGNVRVAVKSGVLQTTYARHNVSVVTGAGNNRTLLGLDECFQEWQGMPRITEREAARSVAIAGGQGHGLIKCNCKGKCDTNRCKCLANNIFCTSKCHRSNSKCCNHE